MSNEKFLATSKEAVVTSHYEESSDSLASRPSLRTLKVQYNSGVSPSNLIVYENDESQPLYRAKLHWTKIIKAHMEFQNHENKTIGTANFHKTGTGKVDLTFHGTSVTMDGYFGTTYSMLSFASQASGHKLRWKRPGQAYHLTCIDSDERELALLDFGRSDKLCGEIEIFDMELAKDRDLLEEVIISGMSYIHLSRYMPSYAGGTSAIGVN